jgi:ABC-type multidrug transport system fused ATPase/permease subunit
MVNAAQVAGTVEMKGFRALLRVLRRFLKYLIPVWDKILLRLVMTQCGAFLGVCSLMVMSSVIDRALPSKSPRLLFLWMGFAFLLAITGTVFGLVGGIVGSYVGLTLDIRMKSLILRHVNRLSLRFYDSRPVGEHMFRIGADTSDTANLIGSVVPTVVEKVQAILTALGLLLFVNPIIAALIGVYIVLYFAFAHFLGSVGRDAQRALRIRLQEMQAVLQQNLSNFMLSRVSAREHWDVLRYFRYASRVARATMRWAIILALFVIGALFLEAWFCPVIHYLFCGALVIKGSITIGEYVALGSMIYALIRPLEDFTLWVQLMRIQAVPAERMLETLDVLPDIANPPEPIRLEDPQGEIVFKNVSFRYTSEGPEVLHGLNFRVAPGKKLAIVGLSGAGKTTVFNLLMRYYDPTGGRILIDGHDLRQLDLDAYHDQVGLVLQDNFLFSATIRDNLLFGKLSADGDDLAEAVHLAGLDHMVESLPDGLDTVLSEGGNLSAGQKQRLAIARAIIRNPRFVYLDEATSALDPVTEEEILSQLRTLEAGRTRLVIAHNIASIIDADEIILLENGALRQRGTHAQLSAQDGPYVRMWQAEEAKLHRKQNRTPEAES